METFGQNPNKHLLRLVMKRGIILIFITSLNKYTNECLFLCIQIEAAPNSKFTVFSIDPKRKLIIQQYKFQCHTTTSKLKIWLSILPFHSERKQICIFPTPLLRKKKKKHNQYFINMF